MPRDGDTGAAQADRPVDAHRGAGLIRDCSMEVGVRDIPALTAVAHRIAPGTTLSIPWLANQDGDARLGTARAVRDLGFAPMSHLAARRIASHDDLAHFISRAVSDAGVDRCFVIAGDAPAPAGPFSDSAALIDTGIFERAGIRQLGIGGHPEAHPAMSESERWSALADKCARIESRGMAPFIVTQFAFDADLVLAWLDALRARGITCPVRIGVPGPARIATLARYAAACGVGACASMLSRYGISIGRLLGTAGPDVFVERFAAGLTPAHGEIGLHVYPFGGIAQSVAWMEGVWRCEGDVRHFRNDRASGRCPDDHLGPSAE